MSVGRERERQNVEFQTMEGKGYYSFPNRHVGLELLDEIRDRIQNITAMRSRNEDRHGDVTDGHVTKQANRMSQQRAMLTPLFRHWRPMSTWPEEADLRLSCAFLSDQSRSSYLVLT